MNIISQNGLSAVWGVSRKRAATEDEYFEADEEEAVPALAYIPAPGGPTRVGIEKKQEDVVEEDDDPSDSYMAGIEKQMQTEKQSTSCPQPAAGVRNDLEEEDDEESYYRYMEENPTASLAPVEGETPDAEYDDDGNPIASDKKKIVDALPPIDHSTIEYKPFEKNFHNEHPEISSLTKKQVMELRNTFDITVSGSDPAKPVSSFAHFNFDEKLLKAIIKAEYSSPTPVQAQAVPCAPQRRDGSFWSLLDAEQLANDLKEFEFVFCCMMIWSKLDGIKS